MARLGESSSGMGPPYGSWTGLLGVTSLQTSVDMVLKPFSLSHRRLLGLRLAGRWSVTVFDLRPL